MAYCLYTELQNLTGSSLSQTILEAIIDEADREIDARLAMFGTSGVVGDPKLKAASLNLSMSLLTIRGLADGSTYKSLTVGPTTVDYGNVRSTDNVIDLRMRATELIDSYIWAATSSERRSWIRKVNE